MNRYVCIHGHFYQPPRENPWLEEIEVQDSAYPYRDWNEKITAECYSPNAAARILSNNKTVVEIINNYSRISFNFGPTLLSWLETHAPDVYSAILHADKESRKRFSGHGAAIAQVYNHLIMPLANKRDKETQVIWGKEDFKYRFGREPEGMWLAETAVDIETLEILAIQGIKFTILAPNQAKRIKKLNEEEWFDVSGSKIDPKRAYLCKLPSGRTISLFFYDGIISNDLAFGNLLLNGENLANRLLHTLDEKPVDGQIAHIATDGETYGHHQKHGDMALAYCLHFIESNKYADITIYGEFLEKFPPEYEVEIIENTSWSCVHGIERWRSNCGCNSGIPDWNQQWRAPLRDALDWLRDTLIPFYEKEIGFYTENVWKFRNNYIKVILDRAPENIAKFLSSFGINEISNEEKIKILKILEMQRHALLMYTSCGWFFDEISGIETVQVILYAARAIQLLDELNEVKLEKNFLDLLKKAPSNIPDIKNGKVVYEEFVKPAIIDLQRVAAHFAVSSLFEEYSEKTEIFCYEVENINHDLKEAGRQKMVIGRVLMRSQITFDEKNISFAFLHLGDHNINGGVRESLSDDKYAKMHKDLDRAFSKLNVVEIVMLIDKHFGTHNYTIWHLFKDESRNVFNKIMENTLKDIEFSFRQIYDNYYPVMQAMKETDTPLPKAVLTAVEFVINTDFKRMLEGTGTIDLEKLKMLSGEAKKWSVELDKPALSFAASQRINYLMEIFKQQPEILELMEEINISIQTLSELSLELDLWKAQNILFYIVKNGLDNIKREIENEGGDYKKWIELFNNLEKNLQVRISVNAHPEINIQTAV
jgi:alpha-amylase/alpha-mannosidase (GH57 family)